MNAKNKVDILLVEDSPTQSAQLRFILEEAGYRLAVARDGLEAVEILGSLKPKLVISDVNMPRMNGYELCRHVKSDPNLRDLPFVLLTTLSEPADIVEGLNSRADHFITKPYAESKLLERVRSFLTRKSAAAADGSVDMGVEVLLGEERHFINADRIQILDLLVATHEKIGQRNQELERTCLELREALRTVGQMGALLGTGHLPSPAERPPTGVEILIVEDSPTEREKLAYVIGTRGYRTTVVSDGEQALAAVRQSKPDLIISDVVMPTLDGYALCRALRATEAFRDLPVVLLTTMSDSSDIVRGIEAGASYYLTKPVNEEYLLSRIDFVLAQGNAPKQRIPENLTGEQRAATPDLQQTLNLLLATYEHAVQQNVELYKTKRQLQELNHELDTKITKRTSGLVKQIAERKQAELALRASEEHYRLLFKKNPLPMWLYKDDETLRFVAVNDAAVEHYGYSESEFLQMSIREIRPVEDVPLLEEAVKASARHEGLGGIWRHRKKSGEIIDVEIRAEAFVLHGTPSRLVLAKDVTEEKRAAESLQASESRFRELAENLRDVFYSYDPVSKRILYVSPAYQTVWGRSCESLYSDPSSHLSTVLPEDRHLAETAIEQALKCGASDREYRILRPNGEVRWIQDQCSSISNARGEVERVVGMARDITERKHLEQQFLRAQRMESIGSLAAGIAHDLNNILSPILMGMELLQSSGMDKENLKVMQLIAGSASRGTDLVRHILSFSRGFDGPRIPLHAGSVVREIESLVSSSFPKSITFSAEISPDLDLIVGDPTQLYQVLLNLCVNARDAMPDGGSLKVTARNITVDAQYAGMNTAAKAGRFVLIEVADTGEGISKKILGRIFEPFFSTKQISSGTGLGLSTVLGIVQSAGGFVTVDSEMGQGSLFKIHLPAQQGRGEESTHEPAENLPRGNQELILLVDDEATIRGITKQTLEAFGYRVLTAEDGAQAINLFSIHREEVAVVLTDLIMPIMDGATLIAALRRIQPDLRIIAASGLASESAKAKIARLGVKYFISKPYSAHKMLTQLRDILAAE